jgi:hypothetical protein
MTDESDDSNKQDRMGLYVPKPRRHPFRPTWVRVLLFFVLLAPVAYLVRHGSAGWQAIAFGSLGLAMWLFNNALFRAGAIFRGLAYKDGENLEQADFSRVSTMGCGAIFWLLALVLAYWGLNAK